MTETEIEDGGFAKIYGDRLEGSSLMECRVATRWCFLFMNSTANRNGFFRCANAAVLARRANITLEEAELAVEELEAPDPDSTTPDNDGRRIVRAQGGWQIVTHQFYRNLRSSKQIGDADRQQNKRERDRSPETSSVVVTPRHTASRAVAIEAEAELEAEADPEGEGSTPAGEIDPHAFTEELVEEINRHLPDAGVKPHPAITVAVANLLAVGHPKGIASANGRAPLTREDLIDAVHGWIVAEARDPWHADQRQRGSPFTFSRLVLDPDRLAEYAERGRSQWGDGPPFYRLEQHPRVPPIEAPLDPVITARHHGREAERLAKVKAWREEKPPDGLAPREERKWAEEHKRRRP